MILSSQFSRQNRNNQSWTNGVSSSQSPSASHHNHNFASLRNTNSSQSPAAPSIKINGIPAQTQKTPQSWRSQTLNRLELQRNRDRNRNRNQETATVQRNYSALGNFPSPAMRPPPAPGPQKSSQRVEDIYAPASIASPREFGHYKRPTQQPRAFPGIANGDSAHYAATSYRGTATPSESGRSGRESALANLIGRVSGTIRRRTKWRRSVQKVEATPTWRDNQRRSSLPPLHSQPQLQQRLPDGQPAITCLDPEIYAAGKREVKAEDIYAEGLQAIDGNIQRRLLEHQIDESLMAEGETRVIVEDASKARADYQLLVGTLTNWINDELSQQRIRVTDLQDDLYDGQILGKLVEKLHQTKLDVVEVTQNESTQRHKLRLVLDTINRILSLQARWARIRWTVDGIHSKNMVEIIHLLVTLAIYYRAPVKLPANVNVRVIVAHKHQSQLIRRSQEVQLTDLQPTDPNNNNSNTINNNNNYSNQNLKHQEPKRDAFDTLIEFAPEKLILVKQALVRFANRHLNKINMSCLANRVDEVLNPDQFSDGLLFVFLISSLEEYFVPLGNLFTVAPPSETPAPDTSSASHQLYDEVGSEAYPLLPLVSSGNNLKTALEQTSYVNTQPIHKLHNVNFALQLMEEAGIEIKQQVRAEDIVIGDLKSVLRVLYALFSRYKHL